MARNRAFAGMKWKFFGVRKRRERTFIHNLCPLCGRRRGASSADRVGRDPCVPPRSTHCSRRGTRAPPYRVRRSHGADRVVCPYAPCHCEPVRAAKQVPLGYRLARQSVSPQRKGRIPTPVTRSLARNDSAAAPRWRDVGDAVPYELRTDGVPDEIARSACLQALRCGAHSTRCIRSRNRRCSAPVERM